MVVNITDVKNGAYEQIKNEISDLKKIAGNRILKVIVETCYLEEPEKVALCRAVTDAGADYIKTSTGFGTGGATMEDVLLFKANIGPGVKIKASGGIRTREDMQAYIEAGCSRLGTSSAIAILTEGAGKGY
jgi:deoxyribose-phosphate aldolase